MTMIAPWREGPEAGLGLFHFARSYSGLKQICSSNLRSMGVKSKSYRLTT